MIIRKIIVRSVFGFGILLNPKLKFIDVNWFKENIKKSEKLAIVAPGFSLSELTKDEINDFENGDIFFLNYAFLNKIIKSSNYLMEPHENISIYANLLKNISNEKKNIFIKGYASPSRILLTLRTIRSLSHKNHNLYLMDEVYGQDFVNNNSHIDVYEKYYKTSNEQNSFLIYGTSVGYLISLAYIAGYKECNFVGFDFSDRYIYCIDPINYLDYKSVLCAEHGAPEEIVHTNTLDKDTLKFLSWNKQYFISKDKKIKFHRCRGELSKI